MKFLFLPLFDFKEHGTWIDSQSRDAYLFAFEMSHYYFDLCTTSGRRALLLYKQLYLGNNLATQSPLCFWIYKHKTRTRSRSTRKQ